MRPDYTKKFKKKYKKLSRKIQKQFNRRLTLFIESPTYPLLRVHELSGKYKGCSSMNITGDIRAVFEMQSSGIVLFSDIGSHGELYK